MAPTAFPIKLWNVVNSENGLITWAEDGKSVLVNENCFDLIVTQRHPNFLRTPSLFSLRRSLRWYNFACSENEGHGFSRYWHPYFIRDREDLLPRVTLGKKRALAKSWLENRLETGLSNGDEEHSLDMQLSAIAMTSGDSVLPSSFRQKLDIASCDSTLEPGRFPAAPAMWSEINGRHSQRLQDANVKCLDTEDADLVKGDFPYGEALHSQNCLCMAFNSTLSAGVHGIDSFTTDAYHPVLYLDIVSGSGCKVDMEASAFCQNDINFYYADIEAPQFLQYLTPDEHEELLGPSFLTNVVKSELFGGLPYLENDFALSGVPVALSNDLDTDQWLLGETRSYFAL